jgi:hypothetical protein
MHHAPLSSASAHGSDPIMSQWPFASWGADAVLGGHDHTYERIDHDGIPYFVNGLGGQDLRGFGTPIPGSQVRYNGNYGALIIDANTSEINFEFIDLSSTTIDSFSITEGGGPTTDVSILDGWVVDGSYATQDATFNVSAGTDRLVLVALSAEKNQNGPISVTSVSLGDQVLTEIFDFAVGSSSAYHDVHWLGYLPEAQIAARTGSALTIEYANSPSDPFDQAKIHYGSYVNVDQTMPIADFGSNLSTSASSLQLGSAIMAGNGDKIVAFNVLGQHYNPGLSTAGYIEVTQSIGATNGHSSGVYHRNATSATTENPTFTSSTGTRMAVSAVVIRNSNPP